MFSELGSHGVEYQLEMVLRTRARRRSQKGPFLTAPWVSEQLLQGGMGKSQQAYAVAGKNYQVCQQHIAVSFAVIMIHKAPSAATLGLQTPCFRRGGRLSPCQ